MSEFQSSAPSRRTVRSLVFHLLYAYDAYEGQASLEAVAYNLARGFDGEISLNDEIMQTAQAIIDAQSQLEEQIKPLLANWRLERLGCCTRLILYMGLWELTTDTPVQVVINESVELAKCFSEKDAYKFVNGVLDEVAKKMGKKPTHDHHESHGCSHDGE